MGRPSKVLRQVTLELLRCSNRYIYLFEVYPWFKVYIPFPLHFLSAICEEQFWPANEEAASQLSNFIHFALSCSA